MYKVMKLNDHKQAYEIIKFIDPMTTARALHDAQNDIYVVFNTMTNTFDGVVYGIRGNETKSIESVSGAIHIPFITFTMQRFFSDPRAQIPISAGMWYSTLLELLADKNNMTTYYTLTGEETPEMLEAMKRIGFNIRQAPEQSYLIKDFLRRPVRF